MIEYSPTCMSRAGFGQLKIATFKFTISSGAGGLLAFAGQRVFGRPAHQRRIVLAEQYLAEADRRIDLHLSEAAALGVATTQRLHQRLGGLLHVLLQVGIGP